MTDIAATGLFAPAPTRRIGRGALHTEASEVVHHHRELAEQSWQLAFAAVRRVDPDLSELVQSARRDSCRDRGRPSLEFPTVVDRHEAALALLAMADRYDRLAVLDDVPTGSGADDELDRVALARELSLENARLHGLVAQWAAHQARPRRRRFDRLRPAA